ncbi:hypothetical protein ABB37_08678 [Leptomonas pyrrhocoris]|uniref:Kelch repeat protein n=1 Tax=Leptomonas pyrrhocoris TaxID=157538 RepID=A0A0N0VDL6_LEPPY|nr:hypothetical protein ABB37_08678 [Leptomonas pyrrhocoris]KPA75408.1 hypothetical protein ABB37_08678 [Leptomonas pyrrhocoris]|eukprot:XP_015653847.1 hypothetical protein ABB37_08678 [Leptomonas pyrrhocoris]
MSFPFRWLAERRADSHDEAPAKQPPPPQRAPPPGCCQTLVCYQERLLVLFGGGSLFRFSNEVYVYDLNCRRWSYRHPENSDIVAPRLGHSAVIYHDTMIVYGGQDLHSPVVYDEVLQLDLATWRWSLLHRAPPFPDGPGTRRLHSAHVIADCMYVLLGTPFETGESPVWSLDLRTGVWRDVRPTVVSSFPAAREHVLDSHDSKRRLCGCCTAVSGNSIYAFGGYLVSEGDGDYSSGTLAYAQTLSEFNATSNTWRYVRPARPFPLPPRRYASAMAVHDGYVYIFGGDANQEDIAWYFADVWRIRVAGDADGSWEHVSVAGTGPSPRSGCAYAFARSSLYLVGGEVGPMEVLHDASYSNETFALPLGYSCALSLRDNVARWIGLPSPQQTPPPPFPSAWPSVHLSLGARRALESYMHC